MVKIDVNKVLGPEESYYSFVLGVAKRAREITDEQLKKVKEVTEVDRGKNTVLDRVKQLPEELSMKPVRLAVEELKNHQYELEILSPEEVLQQEAEEERQIAEQNQEEQAEELPQDQEEAEAAAE